MLVAELYDYSKHMHLSGGTDATGVSAKTARQSWKEGIEGDCGQPARGGT